MKWSTAEKPQNLDISSKWIKEKEPGPFPCFRLDITLPLGLLEHCSLTWILKWDSVITVTTRAGGQFSARSKE
jgi:hypothetical protein